MNGKKKYLGSELPSQNILSPTDQTNTALRKYQHYTVRVYALKDWPVHFHRDNTLVRNNPKFNAIKGNT